MKWFTTSMGMVRLSTGRIDDEGVDPDGLTEYVDQGTSCFRGLIECPDNVTEPSLP
jgi:hypothetical protein